MLYVIYYILHIMNYISYIIYHIKYIVIIYIIYNIIYNIYIYYIICELGVWTPGKLTWNPNMLSAIIIIYIYTYLDKFNMPIPFLGVSCLSFEMCRPSSLGGQQRRPSSIRGQLNCHGAENDHEHYDNEAHASRCCYTCRNCFTTPTRRPSRWTAVLNDAADGRTRVL